LTESSLCGTIDTNTEFVPQGPETRGRLVIKESLKCLDRDHLVHRARIVEEPTYPYPHVICVSLV
jgi:hypothetical protein